VALPQTTLGNIVQGLAPTQVRALRAKMAQTVGSRAKGSCNISTLVLQMKPVQHPEVVVKTQAVKMWLAVMATRMAWPLVRARCTSANRWKHAKGPMTSLIASLSDLGWQPIAPTSWLDTSKCLWILGDNRNMVSLCDDIFLTITNDIIKLMWADANYHHMGAVCRIEVICNVPSTCVDLFNETDVTTKPPSCNVLLLAPCGLGAGNLCPVTLMTIHVCDVK
jgi:hypothetical protein